MKTPVHIVVLLVVMGTSCSTYRKVSLSNLNKQDISLNEMVSLDYRLKKGKLHYVAVEKTLEIRDHDVESPALYDSHIMHVMDNIVVPAGAPGRCLRAEGNQLVIDFGEGVVVPFLIYGKDNRASALMFVGQKKYNSLREPPRSRLYFKPGTTSRSGQ